MIYFSRRITSVKPVFRLYFYFTCSRIFNVQFLTLNSHSIKKISNLFQFHFENTVLLTGTPIQNNLHELYALLSFIAPNIFCEKYQGPFVFKYNTSKADSEGVRMSMQIQLYIYMMSIMLLNSQLSGFESCFTKVYSLKRMPISICMFVRIEMAELHTILKPFLLRRTKNTVVTDLPNRAEVVLYHNLTKLQKKYYKALLAKDTGVYLFEYMLL